jgi:Microsomal signal peptidase 25 kDa subunit (SPC25)
MSDSHSEKYFAKLLIGFGSIIASIGVIFFAVFESGAEKGDWYFWAIVAAFLLCSGIYFALTAFVHKVKSDFSKRSKQRENQKSSIND